MTRGFAPRIATLSGSRRRVYRPFIFRIEFGHGCSLTSQTEIGFRPSPRGSPRTLARKETTLKLSKIGAPLAILTASALALYACAVNEGAPAASGSGTRTRRNPWFRTRRRSR